MNTIGPTVATADTLDNIPRRVRLDKMVHAERAIYDATLAVEDLPADLRLTDAVILLGEARAKVADFVDGIDRTIKPQQPNLGLATTMELLDELSARASVADSVGETWPKYRTVDT